MLKNLHNQQSAPAQSHSSWRVAGLSVALLLISACAAAPIAPTAELQAAETAIKAAEQARVADYASPDLAEARNKLNAANASLQLKEMDMARRLAREAGLALTALALVVAAALNTRSSVDAVPALARGPPVVL